MEDLATQAVSYWNSDKEYQKAMSHWCGYLCWTEPEWKKLGDMHLGLWNRFYGEFPPNGQFETLLEWGPGGGANVVAFGKLFRKVIGVEISQSSLDECARLAKLNGLSWTGVLLPPGDWSVTHALGEGVADAFLCTCVLQHLVNRDAAETLLKEAAWLVRPGGLGLVQWRTTNHIRRPGATYALNASSRVAFKGNTDFHGVCLRCGWTPLSTINCRVFRRYRYTFMRRTA